MLVWRVVCTLLSLVLAPCVPGSVMGLWLWMTVMLVDLSVVNIVLGVALGLMCIGFGRWVSVVVRVLGGRTWMVPFRRVCRLVLNPVGSVNRLILFRVLTTVKFRMMGPWGMLVFWTLSSYVTSLGVASIVVFRFVRVRSRLTVLCCLVGAVFVRVVLRTCVVFRGMVGWLG